MIKFRIIQIMPETSGHLWAIYETTEPTGDDGKPEVYAERVRGYALVEEKVPSRDEHVNAVVPLVVMSRDLVPAEELGNWLGKPVELAELFEVTQDGVDEPEEVAARWQDINRP